MLSQGKHFPRCFGYSFKVGRYTNHYIEENIAWFTDVCNKQNVQIKKEEKKRKRIREWWIRRIIHIWNDQEYLFSSFLRIWFESRCDTIDQKYIQMAIEIEINRSMNCNYSVERIVSVSIFYIGKEMLLATKRIMVADRDWQENYIADQEDKT